MLTIPILDTYSQIVDVSLAGQSCQITIYEKQYTDSASPITGPLLTSLFCDLSVNGTLVIGGVMCWDRTKIVRDAYLGFIGDLVFADTQGTSPPVSPGLGTRYLLQYLEASDL